MDDDWLRLGFPEDAPVESVRHWPGIDWEKRPPRMLCDFSFGTLEPITIQTGPQRSQLRRLDRFRDVHLTWSNFIIDGDRCMSIYGDARTAVSGIVDWPGLSNTAGIYRNGEDFVVSRSRLRDAECISGRTLLASSNEPHNWGMWLLYVLPIINFCKENCQAYDSLLVYADYVNMRRLLALLEPRNTDIILHNCSKAYHFDSLDVFRQSQRDFYVAPQSRAMFAELREKVLGSSIEPSAHRVYVGRRRRTGEMSSYRGLKNERELAGRLAAMGYSEVDPEYLSPEQQIALFGSARQIVALGGAGLFNAVFCTPGTKIISFESNRDHLENHSTILSSMNLDYGLIVGEIDHGDRAFHNKQWTVDVDQAVEAIARFMQ